MNDGSGKAPRVLLKLSGEVLAGSAGSGFHRDTVFRIAEVLVEVASAGYQLGVVTGGGNFARGRELSAFTRTRADYIGMLATVMNCLAVSDSVEKHGGRAAVLSAIPVPEAGVELFSPVRAKALYAEGNIVFFAGGTGNPLLSTDTAAALRAAQTDCAVLYKGTRVDGVYDSDPEKNPDAQRFSQLSYREVLNRDLQVMDAAAVAIARDNSLPIVVFDITDPYNFVKILRDHSLGTVVKGE
ncbi:MAG: UMP kinase [Candidatus Fermentibacteraceae bacterium]|nr:UMP kinase [Candidatus Fermentibacteraceae bacterium]